MEVEGLIEEIELVRGLLITNHRCLIDTTNGTMAIADLHLGYEGAARKDGVYFPRVQKKAILLELEKALDRYSPRTVVIVGDLKHTFDKSLSQEWEEVKEIMDILTGRTDDVRVVRGNHDNFIIGILPKGMGLPFELSMGRLHFMHGHRKKGVVGRRNADDILVLAHEHPSVLLRDDIGAAVRLPCFLYHPQDNILILPAFSTISKGADVLSSGFLSDWLSSYEPGEFLTYAVSEIGMLELGHLGGTGPHPKSPDDLLGQDKDPIP